MNLRELTGDQLAIKKLVEDGELSNDDVKDHLDSLEEDRNKKIENILFVISEMESKKSAIQKELIRLGEMENKATKDVVRLKDYLASNMEDGEKHEFDLFKVSRVKGRDVVNVLSNEDIPMDYMTHKPETWNPDKRAILADLKKGVEISGVEISTGKPSLRIK